MLKLYNSLTKKTEDFLPIHPPKVGLYTCGMTVYDFAHIGHGRTYVGADILRRTLTRFGYEVTHVQNVTDVGHLASDADEGEDKMEKGAAKSGKTVWDVAKFYTEHFYSSMDKLNILRPTVICKATDHIPEQIALIKKLLEKGHAYETPEAVYYDVTTFPAYEKLFGRQDLSDKKSAARAEVKTGEHKKHPADFALWFKRIGRFSDHAMHWDSPWGDGFPGWHIECSAMSMKYLGETFDIHTGGIDHISVHHPNEIAQSEGATGVPFVKYWVHFNFLKVDGKKMSKSLGNFYTVEDVTKKGIDSVALRLFYLTSHYRKEQNFTWDAVQSAQSALTELRVQASKLKSQSKERSSLSEEKLAKIDAFRSDFDTALSSDLNTPQALAAVWAMLKSNISSADKYDLLMDFDDVLGLGLRNLDVSVQDTVPVSAEIQGLMAKRDELRTAKKYAEADTVRGQIEALGYEIEDTPAGQHVKKKSL